MLDVEEIDARLKPGFTALKQELMNLRAPTGIEANLLKAFAQQHPPVPWWRKLFAEPWQWSGVMAMALLVTLVFVKLPAMNSVHGVAELASALHPSARVQADGDVYEDIPFVALESGETILKQDNMRIVQAQIPHTMLASLGVPVSPQAAGEYSTAEMLVGEHDEYLALRFIPSE
ncbi:hypothetical protein [Undibacterium flavidum]|uniref:Uncharacterized protein n=1 Tax=Undibacterium flavidum TaxID=2762297 RepID=A0ABR6YHP3_9BURK|nr:hypothetical protein [Undibacterium flavidum]MBC3876053.1 hypothetical protein [Undibacterium flavidum]